jgi:4-aminobutyrate aminotransferase-like enzyme
MGGLLSIGFEDPSFAQMQDIYIHILQEGVITSHTDTNLRLMPPLVITMSEFERGLEVISKCIKSFFESRSAKKMNYKMDLTK